jgi:hypothetical protein
MNMQAFLGSCWTRRVVVMMIAIMCVIGITPQVDAGFISNSQSSYNRQADMKTVQRVLEHKMVQERLAAMGYSADEVKARMNMLSDEEMHQLSAQIDSLAPAGNGIGLVIGVLVIIILVIFILQLTNKRVVIG